MWTAQKVTFPMVCGAMPCLPTVSGERMRERVFCVNVSLYEGLERMKHFLCFIFFSFAFLFTVVKHFVLHFSCKVLYKGFD